MSPDRKRSWRVVKQEEARMSWTGVETWLDEDPGSRDLRLDVLDHKARILIGEGLKGIFHAEGLSFLRPDLVGQEEDLRAQAEDASESRVRQASGSPDYRKYEEQLKAKIMQLIRSEILRSPAIIRGGRSSVEPQSQVIVGQRLAQIVESRRLKPQ